MAKELLGLRQKRILANRGQPGTREAGAASLVTAVWNRDSGHPAAFAPESLFAAASEPVLIVDFATECIVEANPAAALMFGVARGALVGTPLLRAFDEASADALQASLAGVRTAGGAEPVQVRTLQGGTPLEVKLSKFRANPHTYVLIRMTPNAAGPSAGHDGAPPRVFQALDSASAGFLVTNAGFLIEYANRAFVDMVQAKSPKEVCGEPLARWVKFSAADLDRLRDQMYERRAATLLRTTLQAQPERPRGVEVCAIAVPDGRDTCWGFTVRELPRLN